MQIAAPCVVSLSWRLEDTQGQLIDELIEPLEFMIGGDDLFERVEEALIGQETGFSATLHLEPDQAFGAYEPELVCFESRSLFGEHVEPGMQFDGLPEGATTEGMPREAIYTVTEVYDEHVVIDGNHPLAGIALVLALVVRDVREATEQEIERRSVGEESLFTPISAPQAGSDTLH
ncbi:peptidylprolyl isomerase [Piscinibacter sp. Jin2]|uniref:peptidylprolyl isomerase n=1 Tax=Aquariibacter lacus TaxID=2801332 RepID=A0A9X0XDH7_9BURK|nr:peptidylprolyl isomerase [Piscinibacter lacus]MBL0720267.1 peptidylprolyl isomerase [Piscinibacter lacus]